MNQGSGGRDSGSAARLPKSYLDQPANRLGPPGEVILIAAPVVDLAEKIRLETGADQLPSLSRPLLPCFRVITS